MKKKSWLRRTFERGAQTAALMGALSGSAEAAPVGEEPERQLQADTKDDVAFEKSETTASSRWAHEAVERLKDRVEALSQLPSMSDEDMREYVQDVASSSARAFWKELYFPTEGEIDRSGVLPSRNYSLDDSKAIYNEIIDMMDVLSDVDARYGTGLMEEESRDRRQLEDLMRKFEKRILRKEINPNSP